MRKLSLFAIALLAGMFLAPACCKKEEKKDIKKRTHKVKRTKVRRKRKGKDVKVQLFGNTQSCAGGFCW